MRNAKSVTWLLLLAGLAPGSASAQLDRARAAPAGEQMRGQEEHADAVQSRREPGARNGIRQPQRRRSVQQMVQSVPPIPLAGGPSYGPVLNPGMPPGPMSAPVPFGQTPMPQAGGPSYGPVLNPGMPPSPMTAPAPLGQPPPAPSGLPPPAPITRCTGNLCTDSAGGTYMSGVGNAAVNSQGQLCNRVGNTMQCF